MAQHDFLQVLICPICDGTLKQTDNRLHCEANHSFDIAREGYVNLLVSGHKRPKIMGDAQEMVQARRRFLEMGHFRKLAQAINRFVAEKVVGQTAVSIADIGCGEGWYLGELQYKLANKDVVYLGLDIAKTAVRQAAKKYKSAQFIVANTKRKIPLATQSITTLLNIFAPRNAIEFSRVLKHNGLLLIAIPQANHLHELRQQLSLLDIESEKQQKIAAQFSDGFTLKTVESVTFPMRLDKNSLLLLLQMTPNYWHLTTESWSVLDRLTEMEVTAAFEILLFIKRESPF